MGMGTGACGAGVGGAIVGVAGVAFGVASRSRARSVNAGLHLVTFSAWRSCDVIVSLRLGRVNADGRSSAELDVFATNS
jgi:hypothetical protein